MQKFFKYIISILVLLFLSMYGCDFFYTQVYLKSNSRNKLQYIIKSETQEFDVVFLGSSRVANHVNTRLFDSLSSKRTINLGVEGAGLNDNLLQLKLLVANNKISNVFIQVDFNYNEIEPTNISTSEAMPFLDNQIVKQHLIKHFADFSKLEHLPFYKYAINDPKIGFREMLFSLINKKPKINPSIGYTPKFGNIVDLDVDYGLPKSLRKDNVILDQMIAICKKNNIGLFLFISPFCSFTKNTDYIEKLKKKVPDLIDLTEGYDDSLFFNCGHLNNQGANIFTVNLFNATKDRLQY